MKYLIVIFNLFFCAFLFGQSQTKQVLFLGNSYTEYFNLPQRIADMATSTGDVLIFDSNTLGGYTLEYHYTNSTSLAKIALGNWDFVVLQEQSQRPALPINEVELNVFPYAQLLDSLINAQNAGAETIFYQTWGRKNGDGENCGTWSPVCTYAGMDSLLRLRYTMLAERNEAILSPVGDVWKKLRQDFPLLDLYDADQSHPSNAGTYAAACTFYTVIFKKDPTNITFDFTLTPQNAANIRNTTKTVVYDNLVLKGIDVKENSGIGLKIYPNPVESNLIFDLNKTTNCRYKVVDIKGIEVLRGLNIPNEKQISVTSLTAGIYFLTILEGEKIVGVSKFTKL
jgi:Secretion system C-terminal sorting domain